MAHLSAICCAALLSQEFRQAAHDCDFGVPASALVGDDRILQCALSKQHRLREQEGQQQPRPNGQGATCCGVLLLSNDKVLQLKVSTKSHRKKHVMLVLTGL
jgi:hypothetical protein